jgi:hypothetical protein
MDEAIFTHFQKTQILIWSEQTGLHESAQNKYFAKKLCWRRIHGFTF